MQVKNAPTIIRTVLSITGAAFSAELIVIGINQVFPFLQADQAHIHTILLILILGPLLYLIIYKPLRQKYVHNQEHVNSTSRAHKMLLTVLDSLDAIVYVADIKTHEILFLNRFSRDIFGNGVGKPCWQVMQSDQKGPCAFCSNDKLISADGEIQGMYAWEFQNTVNGHWYDIRDRAIPWIDGRIVRLEIATDITEKKMAEAEREKLIKELQKALLEVKTLQGIIPICAYCKNIRDDKGYWSQVEEYLGKHSEVDFSHGICPTCFEKNFPEMIKNK